MSKKTEKKDAVRPDETPDETPAETPEPTPTETPAETPPVPEQPETDEEKAKLIAENEALRKAMAEMESQMKAMAPDDTPDPDYYVFKHKRFKGDRITLQNGHVIEFKGFFARIRRSTGQTDYELMKNHSLYGIEWEEVNRIVPGEGVQIALGPMTTAAPE